jgi:acetylornithine deacetylase/succinyl-diaminopimelate desuccinylase-like protein
MTRTDLEPASHELEPSIVRLSRELMRDPGDGFGKERMIVRLEGVYEQLGYDLVFCDDAGNLVAVLAGSADGPTLLLLSHAPTVQGPGAAACNAALATQAYGGHLLDTTVPSYRGNLVVAATVGDRDAYGAGTAHLLAETLPRLGLVPALAVLGGPTSLQLCNGSHGRAALVVRMGGANTLAIRRASCALVDRCVATRSADDRESRPGVLEAVVRAGETTRRPTEIVLSLTCDISPGRRVGDWDPWIHRLVRAAVGDTEEVDIDVSVRDIQTFLRSGKRTEIHCATEPWITESSHRSVALVREALTTAGWKKVEVRPWHPTCPEIGAAGSVLKSRHHIPTIGFGPGSAGSGRDENLTARPLRKAALGNATIARALLETLPELSDPVGSARIGPMGTFRDGPRLA